MVYNVGYGGKVQSSSWLTAKIKEQKKEPAPATTTKDASWFPLWVSMLFGFVVLIGAIDVIARVAHNLL